MSPMPADPTRDTRHEIVASFSAQLAAVGYLGVSLDAVAREVGIRKASLYHHFPGGKETLFREAALQHIAAQTATIAAAVGRDGSLAEVLEAVGALNVDAESGAEALDRQFYDATRHVSEAVRAEVSTAYVTGLISPVVDLMARAVADGELVGDPSFLAWCFLGLTSSMAPIPDDLAMPPDRRRDTVHRGVRAVVDLFLDGARPR